MRPIVEDIKPPVDLDRDHWRGAARAAVTLVEYGDYECPGVRRGPPYFVLGAASWVALLASLWGPAADRDTMPDARRCAARDQSVGGSPRMMQRKPRWEVAVSTGWAMRAAGR
jgi:hypothetical protein